MSNGNMQTTVDVNILSEEVFENPQTQNCMIPMGITSENVAEKYGVTRQMQDQLAVESHAKAVAAKKNGWTKDEITPYQTKVTDKDGNESVVTVD